MNLVYLLGFSTKSSSNHNIHHFNTFSMYCWILSYIAWLNSLAKLCEHVFLLQFYISSVYLS
jgi:hypothetical protein